jgi:hypothetical protein
MLRALGIALVAGALLATPVVPAHADTDNTHMAGAFGTYFSDAPWFGGLYYGNLQVAGVWEGTPGVHTGYTCSPTEPVNGSQGDYDGTLRCDWDSYACECYEVTYGLPDVLTLTFSFRSNANTWTMTGVVDDEGTSQTEAHELSCSGIINPLLSYPDDPYGGDYRGDGTCEIT